MTAIIAAIGLVAAAPLATSAYADGHSNPGPNTVTIGVVAECAKLVDAP